MYRCFAAAVVAALFWPAFVTAQDVAFEGTLPDTIVVTASRLTEDMRETGRRVTVLSARDIERLPVSSFDELLRTASGIEAHTRGAFGVQSDLTIRGSTFNGVLVLLDGVRFNDPMTGHFLADFPVPLSEIARIEVLRGPASALYGPDAMGGVIQVFTYAGLRDQDTPASGGEGRLSATGGQHRLYDVDGSVRYASPGSFVSAGGALVGTEGQAVSQAEPSVRTDFSRQVASAAFNRDVGRGIFYVRGGIDDRDFGAYQFYTAAPQDTAREATRTLWAQARWAGDPAGANQWQVQVAARQHDDTYVFNPQTPANQHTSRQLNASARLTRAVAAGWTVTAGAVGHVRGIESNNMGRHRDAAAGGFLSTRWQPLEKLTLNASGRVDADPGYGVEVTPQLGLAYNFEALTLRGAISRAVRAPNYVERYFNTEVENIRGRDLGNPDLKAERAWAYEAGFDVFPTPGLSLHATAFQRDTENLIDFAMTSPEDTVFLARNLHEVRTRGLELDADVHRNLGPTLLRVGAGYTFLDASLGEVSEAATYKYALTHARHLLQLNTTVSLGSTAAGVRVLWKEPLEGDSYHVVHARLGHMLPLGGSTLTVSAEVRNLFDLEYAEIFNAPMPRRWWLAGVELNF